jgi:hypothetical protein
MADLDLSDLDEIVAPTDEQLSMVSRLADQQLALERDIEQLEAELKEKKNTYVKVSQVDLPDAMAAINMSSFKLANGASIDIKKGVDASIKVNDKPMAYSWLREHGHGAIIKNEFKVPFGAGEDALAEKLDNFLQTLDHEYNSSVSIHTQTLRAWARAQLEEGNEIPEVIKVYEYSVAKVIPPKG